jgi:hypothetical protein
MNALKKIENNIALLLNALVDNEEITAASLNDLNNKINNI